MKIKTKQIFFLVYVSICNNNNCSVHNMWIYIKTDLQLILLENGWELSLHNDSAAGDHHIFANNHVPTKSFL